MILPGREIMQQKAQKKIATATRRYTASIKFYANSSTSNIIMDSYRFFPYPRTFINLEELYAKEIKRWTDVSNARLVIMGEGRFCFEDANNPDNTDFNKFIGIVDPQADIDLIKLSSSTIFYTNDDEYTGKIIIIATDGSGGLSPDIFYRLTKFYNL